MVKVRVWVRGRVRGRVWVRVRIGVRVRFMRGQLAGVHSWSVPRINLG